MPSRRCGPAAALLNLRTSWNKGSESASLLRMHNPTSANNSLSARGLRASSIASMILLAPFAAPLLASDHIDSPSITHDRSSDLTDTYAFLDPNDNSQVVLIMSTQGFVVSGEHFGMAIFDHNLRYRFEIENTGDAKPDAFVDVVYSKGLGREETQTATITLPGGKTFTAATTMATQEYKAPEMVISTDKDTARSSSAV